MGVDTKNLRNVVLLGHSGSGKTLFAETMLFESGAVTRRGTIEGQNTISDYTKIEQERGNSLFSSLMHVQWRDNKINIIDTPGYDDFVGEVISSLKVADSAIMIVNSTNGVEVGTELLWEYVEKFKTPALFVVNQLDHDKANYDSTLEQIKSRFGPKVLPVQYPLNSGTGFNTIVDALRMVMYVFPKDGGKPEKKTIPESEVGRAQAMHQALVEAAAENDESLMEKFFDAGSLNEHELAQGLNIALANQQIFPVFIASAKMNMGSGRVMGFINDIAPSPADRPKPNGTKGDPIAPDPSAPVRVFIYKTISEPQVGNVSYFKVYSGTLHTGDDLINMANSNHERINAIYVSNGKNREAVNELKAGDLGVTVKLKESHTNNTLAAKGVNSAIEPIEFPEPRIRVAVTPPNKADVEKLAKALHITHEEDPTLLIEQSSELKQMLLHGQGQLHLDLIKYRIEKVFGISMNFDQPKIPYRETITKMANESFRHKKQTGGAGQFAEVHIRIEPYHEGMKDPEGLTTRNREIEKLPWGGALAFFWCIVGGSIDSKFSNAIKKGVMNKMIEGPLSGSHCRDIRVSVYDGKMHPVDSNDMAFQLAGTMAFKNAFQHAGPQLLEPIYDLSILCADVVMGDVMGDLQTRRSIIMGMEREGHYQKILARVPLAELHDYSSTLRSLTQGKAKFSMKLADYQQVPSDIQQKLVSEYQAHAHDEH
ncbi:MAG TPA: elongation factor G [Saprospiraceae bacterium]|nr:elongation factor G [Saprospiraceae bacterium]